MTSFKGQIENEKILFFAHPHLLIFIWSIIKVLILSALIVFTGIGASYLFSFRMIYGISVASLICLVILFFVWFLWQKTFFIITNHRVLIRTQKGLFHNEMWSVNLTKVRETAYQLSKFLGSIFGYGTILIQSDVELGKKKMSFQNLPHVQDAKFFLDKIVGIVESGKDKDKFPEFINKKKGKRYEKKQENNEKTQNEKQTPQLL